MSDFIDLGRLWRRLLLLVRPGRVTMVDDSGDTQQVQIDLSAAERAIPATRVQDYGFASRPPEGSDVLVLAIGGNGDNGGHVIIATNHKTYRLRALDDGDVALYDQRGQVVRLTSSGIDITAVGDLTITATSLSITADVDITGSVKANGKHIDDTHVHGYTATQTTPPLS